MSDLLTFYVHNYYYYYYLLIRVFHISISWWSFTGDWVRASLLKSPGFFSGFWPSSIMLLFGWSQLSRQLPNPPGPLIIIIIIIIIIYFFRVFHISVSWWSFTRDWETASHLKSPGRILVFWSFSIMLSFGWCGVVHIPFVGMVKFKFLGQQSRQFCKFSWLLLLLLLL